MAASRRGRALVAVALASLALGCGESRSGSGEPTPRPLDEAADPPGAAAPSTQEQARAIAGNPRLLLFDLQTAIEGVFQTRGAYPTSDEFQATESWGLQRAALDAAFDSWSYESDGRTYALSGEADGREFGIHSQQ